MLHGSTNLPIMLNKSLYYAQTPANSLALCAALISFGSVEQVGRFFLALVCGSAFTLTIRIIYNCEGARSLLSKEE